MSDQTPDQKHRHEESDADPTKVAIVGAGLFLVVIASGFVVFGTRACFSEGRNIPNLTSEFREVEREPMTSPGVEIHPATVRERVQTENAARLRGYEWADRDRAHARIPIERAMELVARGETGREKDRKIEREREKETERETDSETVE